MTTINLKIQLVQKIISFLIVIFLVSCSTDEESLSTEPETINQNPSEENETGSEGEEELSINETFELTGLPLHIFELNIPDLPGTESDYQIYIENDSTSIYDLTASKFEFVIPLDTELGEKSLSLKYKDKHYDLGNINIVEIVDVIPTNIGFYETGISSSPLVILDSLNNKIIPFMEDSKVQGISLESPDGKNAYFKLNEYYLPTHIQTDSINIIFDDYNFENGTVDIAYYINNSFENAQIVTGVTIPADILELTSSIESRSFTKTNDEISKVLSAVGVGISGSLCIISGVTALTGVLTWLGTVGVITNCGSFVHSLLATIDPQLENQLATYLSSVLAIKLNTIGCLAILNKPSPLELFNKWSACTELILEGAAGIIKIFEEAEGENQEKIDGIRKILKEGKYIIEPECANFEASEFIVMFQYWRSFTLKNNSNSPLVLSNATSPDDIEVHLPFDVTIYPGNSRRLDYSINPRTLTTNSGDIQLHTNSGESIRVCLGERYSVGFPISQLYGSVNVNALEIGSVPIYAFNQDGTIDYSCLSVNGRMSCESDGTWSFDGFYLNFKVNVKKTYYNDDGEDTVESWSYDFSGQIWTRTFCIGTMKYTHSNGQSWTKETRVYFYFG